MWSGGCSAVLGEVQAAGGHEQEVQRKEDHQTQGRKLTRRSEMMEQEREIAGHPQTGRRERCRHEELDAVHADSD